VYLEQLNSDVQECLAKCASDQVEDIAVAIMSKFDAEVLEHLTTLDAIAQLAAVKRLLTLKESVGVINFSSSLNGIIRAIQKYGHESSSQLTTSNASIEIPAIKEAEKDEEVANDKKDQQNQISEDEILVDENDLDETTIDDTTELSKLTGKTCLEDVLRYAVPVCAPYQALSQYTFRVKLVPGNTKRGKAVKECIEIFTRKDLSKTITGAERYQDLIKKLGDNDWVQVMSADVKIVTAGVHKFTKKTKGKTKK
jgi:hypothetical protein